MKRFTFTSDDYWAVDNQNCFEDQSEDYCGPAIDRLAAYENTGLAPEQVAALAVDRNKWIPVAERLPEDDLPVDSDIKAIDVLVAVKRLDGVVYRKVACRERFLSGNGWRWFIFEPQGSIIYWMPLPDGPDEDEEE